MKSSLFGILSHIVIGVLKFLLFFYIFGTLAINIICFSLSAIEYMETGSLEKFLPLLREEGDPYHIIRILMDGIVENIPFDDFFELLIEDDGSIASGLAQLFTSIFNWEKLQKIKDNFTLVMILRECAVITLSGFIAFVFTSINIVLRGLVSQFAFDLVYVWWHFTSYCLSNCILTFAELMIKQYTPVGIYAFVILISLFIHAFFLGISVTNGKSRIKLALVVLTVNLFFDFFVAVVLWLFKIHFYNMFAAVGLFISPLVFVMVAFALRLIEDLKLVVLGRRTSFHR